MKTRLLVSGLSNALVIVFWLLAASFVHAEKGWQYTEQTLPVAEAADKEWNLKISADFDSEDGREVVQAAKALFAAGWADPRAGEYRDIVIPPTTVVPPLMGEESPVSTRGWVLPRANDSTQQYAVAWNGLVYPVLSIGAKADVAMDVERALKEAEVSPYPGETGIVPDRVSLGKVVMLLRLGMTAEAGKMWKRWLSAAEGPSIQEERPGLFSLLALEWLSSQNERAVGAHVRGQPKLALAYLKLLEAAQKRLKEQAARYEIVTITRDPDTGREREELDMTFLWQVPDLIADNQRRIRENIASRPEIADPDTVADKKERIALLIRDLEVVDGRLIMTPGYLSFSFDPVVKALVAQGEEAVVPLLDALENDARLTDSVDESSGWAWTPSRQRVVRVEEPILSSLAGILRSRDQFPALKAPYLRMTPLPGALPAKELAGVIRAYWEKYRGKPMVERWYGLLADDNAGAKAWAEAASDLILRESEPIPVYNEFAYPGDKTAQMRGEVLRNAKMPSISELMDKRLRQVCDRIEGKKDLWDVAAIKTLARSLAVWDGANHLAALKWHSGELEKVARRNGDFSQSDLISAYLDRVDAGDMDALDDYSAWLKKQDYDNLSRFSSPVLFAPIWLHPDDPTMVKLAEWLFGSPESPWVKSCQTKDLLWLAKAARSPLVAAPSFRSLLLDQLKNTTVLGDSKTDGSSQTIVLPWADGTGSRSVERVRVCDAIANALASVRGVPEFSLDWAREPRDWAIDEIAEFVKRYGDRWSYIYEPDGWLRGRAVPVETVLKFPELSHPASRDEVERTEAIFSNEGAEGRKLWPLPEVPDRQSPAPGSKTEAYWITLKDYPKVTINSGGTPEYDQKVDVWQAEETMVNGQMRRTFGVVAKNKIAAVDGSEIDFSSGQLVDGWSVYAVLEKMRDDGRFLPKYSPDEKLSVIISARNQRGIPRRIPWLENRSQSPSAADLGLEIKVSYFAGPEQALRDWEHTPAWTSVSPRGPLVIETKGGDSLLDTLQSAQLFHFDVARMFDLTTPGFYRVEARFRPDGLLGKELRLSDLTFEVKK